MGLKGSAVVVLLCGCFFSAALSPAAVSRRAALAGMGSAIATTQTVVAAPPPETTTSDTPPPRTKKVGVTVLKNGLRYADLLEGDGESPRWGQLVKFAYTQSVRKGPGAELEKIDKDSGFLIKHGNGRTIRGLDEGLHTMKVGGRRRIEVPPALAYVAPGLGPIPEKARFRKKLNKALDAMDPAGTIVFDVDLLMARTDGADRGYYEDNSFTADELAQIVEFTQEAAEDFDAQRKATGPTTTQAGLSPKLSLSDAFPDK